MLSELTRQQNQHPEKPGSKERGNNASHPSSPSLFCPFTFPTQPVNLFNIPGFTNFSSFAPGKWLKTERENKQVQSMWEYYMSVAWIFISLFGVVGNVCKESYKIFCVDYSKNLSLIWLAMELIKLFMNDC